MKTIRFFELLFACFLMAGTMACSGNDELLLEGDTPNQEEPKDEEEPFSFPKLKTKQAKMNVFDGMEFYLSGELPGKVEANCDSMVWTVKGLDGSFKVVYPGHTTFSWTHWFGLPGEYESYLTAYKDNKVCYCDTVNVAVTDTKDFLQYNWKDITKDTSFMGFDNKLLPKSAFYFRSGLNGEVPYVEIRALQSDYSANYYLLYDYLKSLYSNPTYDVEKTKPLLKMWTYFDELFSKDSKYRTSGSASPIAIWATEKANVALLQISSEEGWSGHVIYAEPVK